MTDNSDTRIGPKLDGRPDASMASHAKPRSVTKVTRTVTKTVTTSIITSLTTTVDVVHVKYTPNGFMWCMLVDGSEGTWAYVAGTKLLTSAQIMFMKAFSGVNDGPNELSGPIYYAVEGSQPVSLGSDVIVNADPGATVSFWYNTTSQPAQAKGWVSTGGVYIGQDHGTNDLSTQ